MKISEKLKIIKQLSGLTQEKLAVKLGVSFATLNSWINNRSQPHRRRADLIDVVLFEYSGVKIINKDRLAVKKEIIKTKSKKYKNILSFILKRPDIYQEFILLLTYNTNRIEGSTLTEDETAAVIFRNETIANKNLIEHLEAKNHQIAAKFLFVYLQKGKIDEKLILKLHSLLMNGIRDDAGEYRRQGVRIVGSNVPTANHLSVPGLMTELIKKINIKAEDVVSYISYIHSRFEEIHPFSDGNGRIGRLIMTAMLLDNNLPPAIVEAKERKYYLSYLRKSQLKKDSDFLNDLICDAVLRGFYIIDI